MGNRKIITIADFKNKALDVSPDKFLDSDFAITEGNIIRMNPIVLESLTLEYTLNGTDYYNVNSNIVQVANGSYFYRFPCSAGDLFNVRVKEGTATTIKTFKAELWLEG